MNLSRIVRLVSPIYCFLHFLHSIIYVRLVELQVIWLQGYRLYGYMVIWLYGYMVIWLYGYMVIWLYGYEVTGYRLYGYRLQGPFGCANMKL